MKKLSLLVGGLILSTAVMAQKPTAENPYSIEGLFGWNTSTLSFGNAVGANTNSNISTAGLRFRYFLSDNLAVRATLGINNNKSVQNYHENENDNTGVAGSWTEKFNLFNLGLGAEYHFTGTERLSPYVGADLNFATGKYVEEGDMSDGNGYMPSYTENYEAKASGFGFNLVAGTDFYFTEAFYFGLELGLGWHSYAAKEAERTVTNGGVTNTSLGNEYKESYLGNNVVGTFRLGWRF